MNDRDIVSAPRRMPRPRRRQPFVPPEKFQPIKPLELQPPHPNFPTRIIPLRRVA